MKQAEERNLQSYFDNYNTITTSLGGIVDGNIQFCGLDVTNELTGNFTQTQALLLWALGRRPTELETKLIDTLIVLNIYPDLRIWSIRVGAYASAAGAPLSSCFGASHVAANSKIFAVEASLACRRFLEKVFHDSQSQSIEELINSYIKRKVFFPGFGRPLIQGPDERYVKLISMLEKWEYRIGNYTKLLFEMAALIQEQKKLFPNYAAIFVALLMDAPFNFDENKIIVVSHYMVSLPSYLPACEINENNQDAPLLPLKVSDILYTGKEKRKI